ncbi:hypothetical protein IMSAG049_00411 [Clostridiales bacterium]|nr:hypothetical protein IMSAG049_00411 [Clostridiales bacterium]
MEKTTNRVTQGSDKSWNEMVEVRLPKAPKTEQNFQFVGVNGKTFQVPRGKTVQVPRPVAEVLNNSEAARQEAEEYENRLSQQ